MFYGSYHGKSPFNHHLGNIFLFQLPYKQIQVIGLFLLHLKSIVEIMFFAFSSVPTVLFYKIWKENRGEINGNPILEGIKFDAKMYGIFLKGFPRKNMCIVWVR